MFKQRYSLHVCLREVKTVFFPSDTLIYGISRDGSKIFNIGTCELSMGARGVSSEHVENMEMFVDV